MSIVEEIIQLSQGAVWLKADLHVHTPASTGISKKWSKATPGDIVKIALDQGLDVIAITDHNTASFCDAIQEAAKDTALTVFPGVEISTPQGHVLAIFDVGTPASKIEDLLIQLGIPRDQFGSLDIATKGGISDVSSIIEAEGGVSIAAHIDGERGLINTVKVAAERRRAFETPALRGLEVINQTLRDEYQKRIKPGLTRHLACIQSSDNFSTDTKQHELDLIGCRYSFIKMGECSISGLKLSLIDPEMRIRFDNDENPSPVDTIIGIWVTGGFLNGQQFRLNENVNCLIGDTGSGKSVFLELIRFGLNQQTTVPKLVTEIDSMLSQQLRDLGTVHILLRKNNSTYLVERTWGSPPTPPSVTRVSEEGTEDIEGELDMQLFFPIKAFSQSEIIEFAREPTVRLSLTDDLIDFTSEANEIKDIKLKLRKNANNIIGLQRREADIYKALSELATLQESKKQIDGILSEPLIEQHHLWYKEQTLIGQVQKQFSELDNAIKTTFNSIRPEFPTIDEALAYPNKDLIKELKRTHKEWQDNVRDTQTKLEQSAKTLLERIGGTRGKWETRFDKAESDYRTRISEIDKDGKGLQALSERKRRIEAQIEALVILGEELEKEVRPQIELLQLERESLLTGLQDNRKLITKKREAKTSELNEKLEFKIRLDVHARAYKAKFREKIQIVGQGSGIHGEDYDKMTDKCHPVSFVKRLFNRDFSYLSEQSDVEESKFSKYYDTVLERNRLDELYDLQLVDIEDVIEVMLQVSNTEYKPIESLAHGQKCMVVLMVALAEGKTPLLVDQPEDALHAPGIEEGIVSTLRSRRGVRQCIFATRNANIIVSADAEQILPLRADANHGQVVGSGCLDCFTQKELVIFHVEGGLEAFQRKQTKYYLKPN